MNKYIIVVIMQLFVFDPNLSEFSEYISLFAVLLFWLFLMIDVHIWSTERKAQQFLDSLEVTNDTTTDRGN